MRLFIKISDVRSTDNRQQTLCMVPELVEGTTLGASTSSELKIN